MKLDVLRKIIREEVRAAVKEELQDMLNEAVRYASKPGPVTKETAGTNYRQVKQKDLARTWSTGKMNTGTVPLEEMLQQTATHMTNEDYKNVVNADSSMVRKPSFASNIATDMGLTDHSGPQPGIDISKLDFVKSAKAIYDKSLEKDSNR
jgi:hypothetical protein|tara:strand:+ start:36 stop:485 length:450 start_codon:yes stop_codon:yes gene_type:complete